MNPEQGQENGGEMQAGHLSCGQESVGPGALTPRGERSQVSQERRAECRHGGRPWNGLHARAQNAAGPETRQCPWRSKEGQPGLETGVWALSAWDRGSRGARSWPGSPHGSPGNRALGI